MLIVPLKQTRAVGKMANSKSGEGNEFKMSLEHFALPQRLLRIYQKNSQDKLKRLQVATHKIIRITTAIN